MGRFYAEIVWNVRKRRIERVRDINLPGAIPRDKMEGGKFYCYMPQNESAYVDFKLFYDKSRLESMVEDRYAAMVIGPSYIKCEDVGAWK